MSRTAAVMAQEERSATTQWPIASGWELTSTSSVASTDGPAMSGVARGTMKGSIAGSSFSRIVGGKIILRAMRKSTIPPLMKSASSFKWSSASNSRWPQKEKGQQDDQRDNQFASDDPHATLWRHGAQAGNQSSPRAQRVSMIVSSS